MYLSKFEINKSNASIAAISSLLSILSKNVFHAEGRKKEVFMSVQEGDYGIVRGAQKLNLSVEEFEKEMSAAGYQIPIEV